LSPAFKSLGDFNVLYQDNAPHAGRYSTIKTEK